MSKQNIAFPWRRVWDKFVANLPHLRWEVLLTGKLICAGECGDTYRKRQIWFRLGMSEEITPRFYAIRFIL